MPVAHTRCTSMFAVAKDRESPHQQWLFHNGTVHYTFKRDMFEDDFEERHIELEGRASAYGYGSVPYSFGEEMFTETSKEKEIELEARTSAYGPAGASEILTVKQIALGIGSVKLCAQGGIGTETLLTLRNVYYVPGCDISGIAICALLKKGLHQVTTEFEHGEGFAMMLPENTEGPVLYDEAMRRVILVARPRPGETYTRSLQLAGVNDDEMAGLLGMFTMDMRKAHEDLKINGDSEPTDSQ